MGTAWDNEKSARVFKNSSGGVPVKVLLGEAYPSSHGWGHLPDYGSPLSTEQKK